MISIKYFRYFQHRWFEDNNMLAFSESHEGLYCRACAIFCKNAVGNGCHQESGNFVKKAFRRLKDFSVYF